VIEKRQLDQVRRKARERSVAPFRAEPRTSALPGSYGGGERQRPRFHLFRRAKGGTRWLLINLAITPISGLTPVKELHHVKQSIRGWRAEPLYARVSPNIDRVNFPRDVLGNRRCQGCLAMQLPFTALLRGKHGGMGRGKVIGLD
jgi:hypothetical protein